MATRPRISTITMTATIADRVDLGKFFNHCDVDEGQVLRVEHYNDDKQLILRGQPPAKPRRKPIKYGFDNQVTAIVVPNPDLPEHRINVKVFQNGTVQMTGCKDEKDGELSAHIIIAKVRQMQKKGVYGRARLPHMELRNLTTRLINSNFRMPFKINNRKLLNTILGQHKHMCIYEPCTYPGLMIMYFWNLVGDHSGVCRCSSPCLGKGTGHGMNQCKKVTVSIFESGSVMITGAASMAQLEDVYRFTVDILTSHRVDIEHTEPKTVEKIDLVRLERRALPASGPNGTPLAVEPDIMRYFRVVPLH